MKLLTLARDLKRRKARHRQARFVAEGVRTVESLLASALDITGALVTTSLTREPRGAALFDQLDARGIAIENVTDAEFDSASDTEAPQGILAIGTIPDHRLDPPPLPARYLILDGIQDPGNAGTMVRTAAALGISATITLPGTVDLWNAKVVRSTMGALFTHPTPHATWEMLTSFLHAHHVPCWIADLAGDPLDRVVGSSLPDRLALLVGNEGAGVSAQAEQLANRRVAIRMAEGVESLNVAVAAGIVLHALRAPASYPASS